MSDAHQEPEKRYRLSIRRPVTMAMLFLSLVVFGWKSYQELPINLMPDISYPTLTVRTEYEGGAPEDIEKLVTRPLEETLSIVNGVVEISSVSAPGISEIVLEFTWDTDMNVAQQDVRDRLDLFDPPREVTEKPVILRYDPKLDPVMRIAITGRDWAEVADPAQRERLMLQELTGIRQAAERHIKSDLEAEIGIAQVVVKGGREEEIEILVDSERLKGLGISLEMVVSSLGQQNINLSGGSLKEGRTEYLVRTLNEFADIREISQAIIGTVAGRQIRLTDVAEVRLGEKDQKTLVRINGRDAVELELFKEGDANTVQVCNKLKDLFGFERKKTLTERLSESFLKAATRRGREQIEEEEARQEELASTLRSRLPEYAHLTLISDQSRFIINSIKEVQNTAIVGGALALAILYLFLREMRSTIIIGIAIPISVITTFVPMFLESISLNIMSLGGLALGIGMLVDNSIVVLESIFRCGEEGDPVKDAAERGTQEVGGAVTASTLTTIAVFLPIAFVEGVAGQLFRDQALTVTYSLLASLLVALYLVPMIASRPKPEFKRGSETVWILRAYRASRSEGHGAGASLARIPAWGAHYARETIAQSFRYTFGPCLRSIRAPLEGRTWARLAVLARKIVAVTTAPALSVFFVLLLILQFLKGVSVTALFAGAISFFAFFRAAAAVCRVITWLPLKVFGVAFNGFRSGYERALRFSLPFSPVFLVIVALLAYHAALQTSLLGRELIPPLRQGEFTIRMEAPPGTRLEETVRRAAVIEAIAREHELVDAVTMEAGQEESKATGNRGENIAQFNVLLKNPDENAAIQDGVIDTLRRQITAATPDIVTFVMPTLFSFKNAVEIQIRGDDLRELKRVGAAVVDAIRGIEGLADPELSMKEGYPEITITPDRDLLAAKGIAPGQMAQRLRTEVQGDVATTFNRAGEKVDIRVRHDRRRLNSLEDLRRLSVTDGNPPVPLEAVAQIEVLEGPSEIRRIDQRQVAIVTANVEGRDLGAVSDDILRRLETIHKPSDFAFILGGQNRELRTSYSSLQFALALAIFLVYVVMASQFESIWHPALIMFSVPLAFVGVIYALVMFDVSLSIVVFIGGIVLAGIVVNNAIVLVDYINQLRRRGTPKIEAVIQAGRVRLRPILMTTTTTVLGLLPMALWSGSGAEIRQPLAITVIAGLTTSTALTLIIIPMVYYLFGGRDKNEVVATRTGD